MGGEGGGVGVGGKGDDDWGSRKYFSLIFGKIQAIGLAKI